MSRIGNEYYLCENIRLFSGTYNLCGRDFTNESLESWFCLHEQYDMYVLGFQELCELNAASVILNNDWIDREEKLLAYLNKDLCTKIEHKLIKKYQLWGIYLLIYANKRLVPCISEIMICKVATGILNTFGNKGTVGISFKLYESRLCFLCSHFNSDPENIARRNNDYKLSCDQMIFKQNDSDKGIPIDEHDLVIWLGDFNYRLESLLLKDTLDLIRRNQFDVLFKCDQLNDQMSKERIFHGYKEGEIRFKPTYKFSVGKDEYDVITNANGVTTVAGSGSGGSKPKLPSWTDRILYKHNENLEVNLRKYSSINMITISDHKPVYATFDLVAKRLDYDRILKESDMLQNSNIPKMAFIDTPELNFGTCSYYSNKSLQIRLRNEGIGLANLEDEFHPNDKDFMIIHNHFGNGANSQLYIKPFQWFKVSISNRTNIHPGAIVTIEISLDFNTANIRRLNVKRQLEDFLVIKCINGNHLFIHIKVDYDVTLIGVSLKGLSSGITLENSTLFSEKEKEINKSDESLEQLWKDLKKFPNTKQEHQQTHSQSNFYTVTTQTPSGNILQAFKTAVIMKDKYIDVPLCADYDFLMKYLIKRCEQNETRALNGDKTVEEQKQIVLLDLTYHHYDKIESNQIDIDILAEFLCDLLECLPHPLVPPRYFDLYSSTSANLQSAQEILNDLPKSHQQLFKLLIKFLKSYSKIHPAFNISVFSNATFRNHTSLTSQFLELFINNHD